MQGHAHVVREHGAGVCSCRRKAGVSSRPACERCRASIVDKPRRDKGADGRASRAIPDNRRSTLVGRVPRDGSRCCRSRACREIIDDRGAGDERRRRRRRRARRRRGWWGWGEHGRRWGRERDVGREVGCGDRAWAGARRGCGHYIVNAAKDPLRRYVGKRCPEGHFRREAVGRGGEVLGRVRRASGARHRDERVPSA